jgi:hypothetical protein
MPGVRACRKRNVCGIDTGREPEADERRSVRSAGEHHGRTLGHDPAACQDGDPVGEGLRLVHVVGRQQDRLVERAQAFDERP